MAEHRQALEDQQEHHDRLLENLREQALVTQNQLNGQNQDLQTVIRQKDAKIEELDFIRKNENQEGAAIGIEMFQQMCQIHQKYIEEINGLNKHISTF